MLDPALMARVGQQPIVEERTFSYKYEELPPEARPEGLRPGETVDVLYKFRWRPYGWAASKQWIALARTAKDPVSAVYVVALKSIIVDSNFNLEKLDLDRLRDDIITWVLAVTKIEVREPEPKKSFGSKEGEAFSEQIKTQS